MPITVADVKIEFYDRYPGAENASDARFYRLLGRADTLIATRFPIRHKAFTFSSMVANQAEYPFAAVSGASEIVQVFAADWWPSSDQNLAEPLQPVDKSYLDQYMQGWRNFPSGPAPSKYGIVPNETDRCLLLVEDVPNAPSSGGYPRVVLYASTRKVYVAGESLPAAVMNMELYLATLCFLYSQIHDRGATADWLADMNYWAKDFENQVYGALPFDRPNIQPALPGWPVGR